MKRPRVPKWFADEMNRQLKKNAGKGGWLDCPAHFLRQSAAENLLSGKMASEAKNTSLAIKQYVDAANFCMMLADKEANV